MVFSSHVFLLFFLPFFLLLYFVVPARWRNGVLLGASLFFYAWGAPDFVLILFISMMANYYLVRAMYAAKSRRVRLWLSAVSIALNVGLLVYFKYANFFVDNFNTLLLSLGLSPMTWTRVLLPIGISFFSFQSITYVIDTYRNDCRPMERLSDYMLYIVMFPQMIAGPIVRFVDIADQIVGLRRVRWDECLQGLYRFVVGLSKKVLVADLIGRTVDVVLQGDLTQMGMGTAWVILLGYTMQIYFDFSGYSDMAIGLGRILGFRFPENFDNPYTAASITEFWRRWHITLGAFMRSYLYIPLGGNRCGRWRTYLNLWVVFLLSGLWHGANWNFVLWGAYHGFFLVVERMTDLGKVAGRWRKLWRVPLTFVIVMIGWAIFRIEDLSSCWMFLRRLFSFATGSLTVNSQYLVVLVVALLISLSTLSSVGRRLEQWIYYTNFAPRRHLIMWPLAMLFFSFCIAALTATDFSPFIYFRF